MQNKLFPSLPIPPRAVGAGRDRLTPSPPSPTQPHSSFSNDQNPHNRPSTSASVSAPSASVSVPTSTSNSSSTSPISARNSNNSSRNSTFSMLGDGTGLGMSVGITGRDRRSRDIGAVRVGGGAGDRSGGISPALSVSDEDEETEEEEGEGSGDVEVDPDTMDVDEPEASTSHQGGAGGRSRRDTIRAHSHHAHSHSQSVGSTCERIVFKFPSYISPPGIQPSPAHLPHEIILSIIRCLALPSDLKSALLVCKSWCQCAVEFIWFKPSFGSTISNFLRMLIVVTRTAKTTAYREMYPADCAGEEVEGVMVGVGEEEGGANGEEKAPMFPYPRYIRRLNFSLLAPQTDNAILKHLLPCTRLERLTLSGCAAISDEGLIPLVRRLKGLISLDLSDCVSVGDEGVAEVGKNCKKLQGLNLSGCKSVGDPGVGEVAKGCKFIRRIKLRGLTLLTDEALVALCIDCPLLLEIDVALCTKITPRAMWTLFRLSTNVREISMTNLPEMDETAFAVSTSISRVNVDSYREELKVMGYPSSTSAEIEGSSSAFGPLDVKPFPPVFDHLRFLDLSQLTRLTDDAVDGIVTQCPRIRNFLLAKCSGLTDASLNSLGRLGKHLHYLHLGHVVNITDKAVIRLARNCTRLRYIDLACCTNLTDASVIELAHNLLKMKRIGLVRVQALTDAAIFALCERSSLERIHLSYCDRITVSAVHYLLIHLLKLTHLSLTGVNPFRRGDLQYYCRPAPKDFNTHQRNAFCVYSGKGVSDLRRYMTSLAQNRGWDPSRGGRATDQQLAAPSDAGERLQYQPAGGVGIIGRRGTARQISNLTLLRQQMEASTAGAGGLSMEVDHDWRGAQDFQHPQLMTSTPMGGGMGMTMQYPGVGQRSLSLPPEPVGGVAVGVASPSTTNNALASTSRMVMGSPHPHPSWTPTPMNAFLTNGESSTASNGGVGTIVLAGSTYYRLVGTDENGSPVYQAITPSGDGLEGMTMPGAFERNGGLE